MPGRRTKPCGPSTLHDATAARIAALCCLLASLITLASPPAAGAVTVRVRGSSQIEGRTVSRADRLQVHGTLTDDSGAPIRGAPVRLQPGGAAAAGHDLLRPEVCPKMPAVVRGETEITTETDQLGRFCVAVDRVGSGAELRVWFGGDDLHDPSPPLSIVLDASKRAAKLGFAPRPRYLSLDRSSHVFHVDAELQPADGAIEPLQLSLWIVPRGGDRRTIGSQSAPPGGRVRFEVDVAALGEPGPATLGVTFAGSDQVLPAEHSIVVERTARADLSLAGKLLGSDPTEGVTIPVAIGSSLGAVSTGIVEAVFDGRSVGTAPVKGGSANVRAVFEAPPGTDATVLVRYLPGAPWWRPGPPLHATIAIDHPSGWRLWPWAIGLLLISALVIRSWHRPARIERAADETASGPPSGRASIEVIERGPPRGGWHGRVVDAHEGVTVAGARLAVSLPTFGGDGETASCVSDADGKFTLPALPGSTEGARLLVHSRWHAALSRPLPPAGHLQVNLVSRRRALVNRLVDWAERMGYPWRQRGEPTPGEVRAVAASQDMSKIERWAGSVEEAAYGPADVDEAREREVRGREPHWKGGEDTSR